MTNIVGNFVFNIFISMSLLTVLPTFCSEFDYPARLQPEYDLIDVNTYLQNDRLFNLQMQCIIFDGPCDSARVAYALLGECLKCTPKQEDNMNKILAYVQEKRPDLYRAAIAKYLQHSGIPIPEDEQVKAQNVEDQINNGS